MVQKIATLVKLLFVFSVITPLVSKAEQNCYWVFFKDKAGVEFNPYTYFDTNTIARRIQANIPLNDSSDYPVKSSYIELVQQQCDSITIVSRWFNAVKIWGSNATQLSTIRNYSFVERVEQGLLIGMELCEQKLAPTAKELTDENKELAKNQLESLGLSAFKNKNISGKGVRVAVFDAGFPGLDVHELFEKQRAEKRIINTWNFLTKNADVYKGGAHGIMTTGCVAGLTDKLQTGLATGCELLLAITEYNVREPFREEEFWLAAAEWADKNGADIISSSLGYSFERYFYKDMNGHTSLVAKAARMATRKGILVVNSAGNEFTNSWKFIITPADVDSVLAVGGIDPKTGYHISFSSIGPNSKNMMKPNVCAFGHVLTANKKDYIEVDGTSFSCPLISGFAACALELYPQLKGKPMELFDKIQTASSLYPYFDYMHGYGVPQAEKLISESVLQTPSFDFEFEEQALKIVLHDSLVKNKVTGWEEPLYYHIENEKGVIIDYYLLTAQQKDVLKLEFRYYTKGQKVMIHYNGYTASYTF